MMMVVCMGPMLSQRVRGWFHRGDSTEAAAGAPSDAGTDAGIAAEVAALRCEVAELRALRRGGGGEDHACSEDAGGEEHSYTSSHWDLAFRLVTG